MTEKKQQPVKDLQQPRDGESFINYGNRVMDTLKTLCQELELLIAKGKR